MFLLPCQTLQGKHYRLNCLIPVRIIRRSDNCKNRDAEGRLRVTYACCQPFATGKVKLKTRQDEQPCRLPAPNSLTSQEPFSPLQPPAPCTHRIFTALCWDSELYCSAQIFYLWTVWSRTFQTVLVLWAAPQNPRQQNAACLGHGDLSFALHCKKVRQNLSLDKWIPLGSPILLTSPDIWKIWLIFYFTCQCLSKFMNLRCWTSQTVSRKPVLPMLLAWLADVDVLEDLQNHKIPTITGTGHLSWAKLIPASEITQVLHLQKPMEQFSYFKKPTALNFQTQLWWTHSRPIGRDELWA